VDDMSERTDKRRIEILAWAAVVGQIVFLTGWLVLGALEGHGYSPGRDDISDLGAPTAQHVAWNSLSLGISAILSAAFAIGALAPALRVPGKRAAVGAWLVALSLVSLDNLSDVFFHVDCRAADAGCTPDQAFASWHGKIHLIVFVVAAVATVAAPFALAYRMRIVDGWKDLARPTRVFGAVLVVGLIVNLVLADGPIQGWAQRGLCLFVVFGIVSLARRVLRLANDGAILRPMSEEVPASVGVAAKV
jgi:hypothetical protein